MNPHTAAVSSSPLSLTFDCCLFHCYPTAPCTERRDRIWICKCSPFQSLDSRHNIRYRCSSSSCTCHGNWISSSWSCRAQSSPIALSSCPHPSRTLTCCGPCEKAFALSASTLCRTSLRWRLFGSSSKARADNPVPMSYRDHPFPVAASVSALQHDRGCQSTSTRASRLLTEVLSLPPQTISRPAFSLYLLAHRLFATINDSIISIRLAINGNVFAKL